MCENQGYEMLKQKKDLQQMNSGDEWVKTRQWDFINPEIGSM